MVGHEMGEFTPKGEYDGLVEATKALRILLDAYNGQLSLSEILIDIRAHSDIIWKEADELDLRLSQSMALSELLIQFEGSTTLVEILEDIRGKTPYMDDEEGEYSRESADSRYLRKAGDAWVDENDGTVIVAGMKFNISPSIKRKPVISKIVWKLIDVSDDGRTVKLISVRYSDGMYIENLGAVDEVPYGVFRDMYLVFPNS